MKLRAILTLDVEADSFRDAAKLEDRLASALAKLVTEFSAEASEMDLKERRAPRADKGVVVEEVVAPSPAKRGRKPRTVSRGVIDNDPLTNAA